MRPIAVFVALTTALLGGFTACSALRRAGAQQVDAPLAGLEGPNLLFQPKVTWSYDAPTGQGTGFFVEHAGKRYGVTSSHYLLDATAGELAEISAAPVAGDEASLIATTHFSWGIIGPDSASVLDLSRYHDYTILPFAQWSQPVTALKLSDAQTWDIGTPVWLPAKDPSVKNGIRWTKGKVTGSVMARVDIELAAEVDLSSLSGSPVLEASTGAVIGTLSRASVEAGKPIVLELTPAAAILRAIEDGQGAHALPVARRVAMLAAAASFDSQAVQIKKLDSGDAGGDGWISAGRAGMLLRGFEYLAKVPADNLSNAAARGLSLTMEGRLPAQTTHMLKMFATAGDDERKKAVADWLHAHNHDVLAFCPSFDSLVAKLGTGSAEKNAILIIEACPISTCSSTLAYPDNATFSKNGNPFAALIACIMVEQLQSVGGPHPLELALMQAFSGSLHQRMAEPERATINEIYGKEKV